MSLEAVHWLGGQIERAKGQAAFNLLVFSSSLVLFRFFGNISGVGLLASLAVGFSAYSMTCYYLVVGNYRECKVEALRALAFGNETVAEPDISKDVFVRGLENGPKKLVLLPILFGVRDLEKSWSEMTYADLEFELEGPSTRGFFSGCHGVFFYAFLIGNILAGGGAVS